MNSLILDTSTDLCIIAIAHESRIAAQEIFAHKNQLSATLLPSIQRLVEQHCIALKNIQTIALGIGPGSYTGTRLGAAVAKSLAFGLELPIKTFASPLAFLPNHEGNFAFMIPARTGQFYLLTGSVENGALRQENSRMVSPEEADQYTSADFLICPDLGKLPATLRNKPCYLPSPDLNLLAHWLWEKEQAPLDQIELIYLGSPGV